MHRSAAPTYAFSSSLRAITKARIESCIDQQLRRMHFQVLSELLPKPESSHASMLRLNLRAIAKARIAHLISPCANVRIESCINQTKFSLLSLKRESRNSVTHRRNFLCIAQSAARETSIKHTNHRTISSARDIDQAYKSYLESTPLCILNRSSNLPVTARSFCGCTTRHQHSLCIATRIESCIDIRIVSRIASISSSDVCITKFSPSYYQSPC